MGKKWNFFAWRIGQMIITLLIIITILFLIFRLMPGNPLAAYVDFNFTFEHQEILMKQFGLDKPLWQQYLVYLANLFKGQLGDSFTFNDSVTNMILKVLPNTIYLMIGAFLIAYFIGILGGAFLVWKRGTIFENTGLILTLCARSTPQFWVGMVFLALLSFKLEWFPSGGTSSVGFQYTSEFAKLTSLNFYHHISLPLLTLAIYLFGLPLLLMRSNMLDIIGEAYVDLAKMRGISEGRIMLRYIARNALLPVVTAMTLNIGYAIGGSVVVETVFAWPGLGRLLVKAVSASDYPLTQGAFLIIATILVVMNFLTDILYSFLDPRIKIGE